MTPKEYAEQLVNVLNHVLDNKGKSVKVACIFCARINDLIAHMHKPEYALFDIYEPKQLTLEGEPDHLNGYQVQYFMDEVLVELDKL